MIKVMLVEDNRMVCEMISERLGLMGYQTRCALDGKTALEQVPLILPDIILMDISLTDMDGWAVTAQLKADPRTRDIPVIALSAHAMMEARERSLAVGCADFEVKPINFAHLGEKINALVVK
jgi:CheY-like chemotaxis protein